MSLRLISLALFVPITLARGEVHSQTLPPPRVLPSEIVSPPMPLPPARFVGVLPPHGKPIPTLPLAASPIPVPGYQPSAYQVWQNYGVTYNGWLRPRVVQVPEGGFWVYNGAPYPYVYTWPGKLRPSVAPTGPPAP